MSLVSSLFLSFLFLLFSFCFAVFLLVPRKEHRFTWKERKTKRYGGNINSSSHGRTFPTSDTPSHETRPEFRLLWTQDESWKQRTQTCRAGGASVESTSCRSPLGVTTSLSRDVRDKTASHSDSVMKETGRKKEGEKEQFESKTGRHKRFQWLLSSPQSLFLFFCW